MRCYLEGYRFEVITDHLALKWLASIESPSGRIARWALELQQFQFDVRYRRGKLNVVADTLSRQPCEVLHDEPEKFADYMLENGQLYRNMGYRADDEYYFPWKLCVPTPHRARVLYECHDSPTAGHLGVLKTITRLSHIRLPACHKDISGPACTVTQNTTFGTLGVDVQYTAPYCPQENPTERTNRTLKTLMSQLSEDDQSSLDSMLPEISLAINSSISGSTGYTPGFLTQGRELLLPAMLYDELTPGSAVVRTNARESSMDEVIIKAFYPGANYGDGLEEEEEKEFLTSEGEAEGSTRPP
ncbi:uncharacterized protein [Drosophila suzukii]|uniref:RNA-directed DNA polymerase n=1 Tax=Drosophila suzukii TaxID=28584 RepID=A0ABM4TXI3_DROSZ